MFKPHREPSGPLPKFAVHDADIVVKQRHGNTVREGPVIGEASLYSEARKVAGGDVFWRTMGSGAQQRGKWVKYARPSSRKPQIRSL